MSNTIGIIDYGAGNIFSLTCALDRQHLSYRMVKTEDDFHNCDRYIIPGVGHAGAAMKKLEQTGLIHLIRDTKKPILGICVGMQLLTDFSEEGNSKLMGIVPVNTKLFTFKDIKVPHIGWNTVTGLKDDLLFKGLPADCHFYFVHSYFIEFNLNFTTGSTLYGTVFSASVRKENFRGLQFHPEKSGENGERVLNNFYHLNN